MNMHNLHITTIQAPLHWESPADNLAMFGEKIALAGRTNIIVLPEMFTTGFSMQPEQLAEPMDGRAVQWMKATAKQYGVIITGSLMISENGHFFNRMIWMQPDGGMGYYDKRHLFAYAGEHQHYTAGNQRVIARVNGWRLLLAICYDLRFPVWLRQQAFGQAPEYDAILLVANWPQRRSDAWITLLKARAIENQCFVIGVNRVGTDGNGIEYNGLTSVIAPDGQVMYQLQDLEATAGHVLDAALLASCREKLPFLHDRDAFSIR